MNTIICMFLIAYPFQLYPMDYQFGHLRLYFHLTTILHNIYNNLCHVSVAYVKSCLLFNKLSCYSFIPDFLQPALKDPFPSSSIVHIFFPFTFECLWSDSDTFFILAKWCSLLFNFSQNFDAADVTSASFMSIAFYR